MFQIHTSRLILRDLHEDDAPLIWRMAHEDAIRRYQEVLRLESEDAIVEFIRTAIIHNNQQPRQGFNLVIVERQRKQSIGWIGWGHSEDSTYGDYSVGYALLPQYWGIGYMTEALRSALTFMFRVLEANGVSDYCEVTNRRSARVMEKQGMKVVASWPGEAINGSRVEYSRYAIQRAEWFVLNPTHFIGRS